MNQILSFTYEANTTTEDGTPFFCANDVATTLDTAIRKTL